jgi:hypothetical protein
MTKTRLLFLNHSSVLLQYGDAYLLTDPWYQKPAFGSWLPNPPLAFHPAYLAALSGKAGRLRILVSHAHDDHCDDDFLALFDKRTRVISADFASPSVKRRMTKIGLEDFTAASEAGVESGPFVIRGYINRKISLDDAVYTIETPDAFIVHANDNWSELPAEWVATFRKGVTRVGRDASLYMSQTNSASGFPMTYDNFSAEERRRLLANKVRGMMKRGALNCAAAGARHFLSYAGFASVFVKNHSEYFDDAISPSPAFIREHWMADLPEGVELLDLMPGDSFDFRSVRKSFLNEGIGEAELREASRRFYETYGAVEKCDSYSVKYASGAERERVGGQLKYFLEEFNSFVMRKTASSGFEPTILGKIFAVEVEDLGLKMAVKFGGGLVSGDDFNKKLLVDSVVMRQVLDGVSWFENLYTGYNGRFVRNPAGTYNRDIVVYMTMFSYVYKAMVTGAAKA